MQPSISLTLLKVSSGPPVMIASVPSFAFGSPPLTGASSITTSFLRSSSASSLETEGAIELMSITIDPGLMQ